MHMYNFILRTMTNSEINVQYRYNYDPTNIQFLKYNNSNTQYIQWARSYTDNAVLSVDIYENTIQDTKTNIVNCPCTILHEEIQSEHNKSYRYIIRVQFSLQFVMSHEIPARNAVPLLTEWKIQHSITRTTLTPGLAMELTDGLTRPEPRGPRIAGPTSDL